MCVCICAWCWCSCGTDDHNVRIVVDSVAVARPVSVDVRQWLGGQGPTHRQRPSLFHVVLAGVAHVRLRTGADPPLVQPRLPDDGTTAAASGRNVDGVGCSFGVYRQQQRSRCEADDSSPVGGLGAVGGRDQHGSVEPSRRAVDHSHCRMTAACRTCLGRPDMLRTIPSSCRCFIDRARKSVNCTWWCMKCSTRRE